jgi:hypothetical protein
MTKTTKEEWISTYVGIIGSTSVGIGSTSVGIGSASVGIGATSAGIITGSGFTIWGKPFTPYVPSFNAPISFDPENKYSNWYKIEYINEYKKSVYLYICVENKLKEREVKHLALKSLSGVFNKKTQIQSVKYVHYHIEDNGRKVIIENDTVLKLFPEYEEKPIMDIYV